ncbi:MAG: hypothetical protein JSU03_01650 [Bacteroidetes bacterium]|nr:hypothetical protein [Bacteroidota bacterium]MBS1755960.1 hypothetical protein [Bacteroidota bacterium]
MHNFTQEDLLLFLYKEASPQKTASIQNALVSDWNLREEMEVLASSIKQLNSGKLYSPRQKSIDAILEYAEKATPALSVQH